MKLPIRSLLPIAAAALLALPAGATTYQMMSDQALADQSPAAIRGRIVGVEPAPVSGRPATDYLVEVERVLKGDLPGSTVVVRVPGGMGTAGLGLKIWGAPAFKEGEEAVLFLAPAEDGTYRLMHLMLGAFHERRTAAGRVALRDLSEAHEVAPKTGEKVVETIRDAERFADWVADRAAGIERERDYLVGTAGGGLASAIEPFSFMESSRGFNIRWFRFDQGQGVAWRVHNSGQSGLGLEATIDSFKVALNAWVSDSTTNINLTYVGTTDANGGFARSDDTNTILFDDPYKDDPENAIEGRFGCRTGGVIAIGGPYFFDSTRAYKGRQYHEAVEADIVTNDGTSCLFTDPLAAQEVFAHELGHTLGLSHSQDWESLMFPNAHDDGRGARVSPDDRAAIAVLYTGSGKPTGGAAPVAPTLLKGRVTAPTEVTLTWRDKAKNEEEFRIEVKLKGAKKYQEAAILPADSTSAVIGDLTPGKSYQFRVRAAGGGKFSKYSNVVTVVVPKKFRG